jgi:hypothetical protein
MQSQVKVEWTVGDALKIDDAELFYGKWSDVPCGVDCMSQPSCNLSSLVPVVMQAPCNHWNWLATFPSLVMCECDLSRETIILGWTLLEAKSSKGMRELVHSSPPAID